jgi:hypothetical protein
MEDSQSSIKLAFFVASVLLMMILIGGVGGVLGSRK